MVYKESIFIFGGYDGFNRVNDFYEYNVTSRSWQEVLYQGRSTAPSPRHSHSAVVYKDSMYVFGGYDGKYKNDFFKFDFLNNDWSEICPESSASVWPKARYRTYCIVYKDKMYIFGGHDGSKQLNDFFYFDFLTSEWQEIEWNGDVPTPRDSHILVNYGDSIFLFGGSTGNPRSDFYEYKITQNEWTPVALKEGHSKNIPTS